MLNDATKRMLQSAVKDYVELHKGIRKAAPVLGVSKEVVRTVLSGHYEMVPDSTWQTIRKSVGK